MHVEPDERELDVIGFHRRAGSVGLLALPSMPRVARRCRCSVSDPRADRQRFCRARIRDVEGQAIEEAFAQNKIAGDCRFKV